MNAGQHQQQRKAALRERMIAGPSPGALRAIVSAVSRERDKLSSELIRARSEIQRQARDLDDALKRLANARELIATNDPAGYWKACHEL